MAAIVQWLERLIVVQEVVGSTPTSRPIFSFPKIFPNFLCFFGIKARNSTIFRIFSLKISTVLYY
jgi:hypothetical protein